MGSLYGNSILLKNNGNIALQMNLILNIIVAVYVCEN